MRLLALAILASLVAGCVGRPDRWTAGYQQDPNDREDSKVSVGLSGPITYGNKR